MAAGSWIMSNAVDKLLKKPVNFLAEKAPGIPVVISTRIRLARNLQKFPFPIASNPELSCEVAGLIAGVIKRTGALGARFHSFRISELDALDKELLLERRLVSRELLAGKLFPEVHTSNDERLSVMVNEEDHLRMQVVLPGLQLSKAWKMINKLDDKLSCELETAYDPDLGYLTACPSNVGTGMRVSVMLHLPALTLAGHIKQLERGLAKLGLTVRGIFGEGSDNLGNFYQISNQSTLGESESVIIENLGRVIDQVINHEESVRYDLLEKKRSKLMDLIGRSYGVLRHSYLLSGKEALCSLSGVRLGVDMNMFTLLDRQTVNELFIAVSPAHLQKLAGCDLPEAERDALRAKVVRERLKQTASK